MSLFADVRHAAGVVNITGLATVAGMALALRRHVDWKTVARTAPGIIVGVWIGLVALDSWDTQRLELGLGVTIVAISLWNLSAWRPLGRAPGWQDAPVGVLSGTLTGLFNTGAPPLIAHLYRRDDSPDQLRGTLQALFLVAGLIRLPAAMQQGMITERIWWDSGIGLIAVLAGSGIGLLLGRHLTADKFQRVSWVALGVLGLGIAIFSA
jgi:hypothetical protein